MKEACKECPVALTSSCNSSTGVCVARAYPEVGCSQVLTHAIRSKEMSLESHEIKIGASAIGSSGSFGLQYGQKSHAKLQEEKRQQAEHMPHYHTAREQLLLEAIEITHKDRNTNYGNPEDNFQQIANLWNAYLGNRVQMITLQSHDVAIMSMLIKVARLAKNSNHHDSAVDVAGYAACLADIQKKNIDQACNVSNEIAQHGSQISRGL